MQDGDNSPTEFHKVLQEVEKYRKLKADIRDQTKTKVKEITKEQWEELLKQERKEGKEEFLWKIANIPGIQSANPFKIWSSSALRHVILWSIKTIKIGLILYFQYVESTSGSNTSPVLLWIIVSPSITIFFEVLPTRASLSYHPLTFDDRHVDQWSAAFEVHPDMPYRRGYPNQK